MQEVKNYFSKWFEKDQSNKETPMYAMYVNNCKSNSSKIDKITLLRDMPAMTVYHGGLGVFYVGTKVTQFYERCVQEIEKEKRGETPDPSYLLSRDVLEKINTHYRFDLNNFEITQAEMNRLFERYHLKILEALKHEKVIIVSGEYHCGLSLLQDLMVFEILKDKEKNGTKRLKNLFIEGDNELYQKILESKSIYKDNDLFSDNDSFLFLSHLALSYGIQVIPVENSMARDMFSSWNSSVTMYIRDHYMASNIAKTPLTSEDDISMVLCGGAHVKGLKHKLEKAGYYILDLNVADFQIKSKTGLAKVMVYEKDNRDIHYHVLLAKLALMEKTGDLNNLLVEKINTSKLMGEETADDEKQSQVSSLPLVQPLSQDPCISMPLPSLSDIQKSTETKSLGSAFAQSSQRSKDKTESSKIRPVAPLIASQGLLKRSKSLPNLSTGNPQINQELVRSKSFSKGSDAS